VEGRHRGIGDQKLDPPYHADPGHDSTRLSIEISHPPLRFALSPGRPAYAHTINTVRAGLEPLRASHRNCHLHRSSQQSRSGSSIPNNDHVVRLDIDSSDEHSVGVPKLE